jgi:hypothetical protein
MWRLSGAGQPLSGALVLACLGAGLVEDPACPVWTRRGSLVASLAFADRWSKAARQKAGAG